MKRKSLLVLALMLAGLIGASVWWLSSRVPERVVGTYFDSNGVRIHYTDEGSGTPVVLIHGFAANADMNWREPGITETLAKSYRVIAIDNRGHGLSDKPHDPSAYGRNMPEDVLRLLDHLGIEKAHIVGYSMGAFITVRFMIDHPDRCLSASPCGAGWPNLDDENAGVLTRLRDSLAKDGRFDPLFEILMQDQELGAMKRWTLNMALRRFNDVKALTAVVSELTGLSATEEELRACSVPSLSVVGTRDPLKTSVESLARVKPNSRVVLVEKGSHLSTVRRPEMIASLLAFIEENTPSTALPENGSTPLPAAA